MSVILISSQSEDVTALQTNTDRYVSYKKDEEAQVIRRMGSLYLYLLGPVGDAEVHEVV